MFLSRHSCNSEEFNYYTRPLHIHPPHSAFHPHSFLFLKKKWLLSFECECFLRNPPKMSLLVGWCSQTPRGNTRGNTQVIRKAYPENTSRLPYRRLIVFSVHLTIQYSLDATQNMFKYWKFLKVDIIMIWDEIRSDTCYEVSWIDWNYVVLGQYSSCPIVRVWTAVCVSGLVYIQLSFNFPGTHFLLHSSSIFPFVLSLLFPSWCFSSFLPACVWLRISFCLPYFYEFFYFGLSKSV